MKTVKKILPNKKGKLIPILIPIQIDFPVSYVEDFKSYCGAGEGIGDLIVPEKIYNLIITPACFVHDKMWELSKPTWDDFHYSNSVFLHNLISLIENQSKSDTLKRLRLYRAITYYNAVDSIGKKIFWNLKS